MGNFLSLGSWKIIEYLRVDVEMMGLLKYLALRLVVVQQKSFFYNEEPTVGVSRKVQFVYKDTDFNKQCEVPQL